jgi:hypothetical protein
MGRWFAAGGLVCALDSALCFNQYDQAIDLNRRENVCEGVVLRW